MKIGLGSIVAMILSWAANHSIGWLLLHGLFGWYYVAYYIAFELFVLLIIVSLWWVFMVIGSN